MLQPSRTKYRKAHKGRNRGAATSGALVSFGDYGLKVLANGQLTGRQIEAARRAIVRAVKRAGKLWIRVFPDKPVSKKPAEVRMGSGKGSPEFWCFEAKAGKILYEMEGVSEEAARRAFRLGAAKLPLKTRFVTRRDNG
jgi:large subunit ribosomal protein L16